MSFAHDVPELSKSPARPWRIALWVAQIALFVLFGMPGVMKTFMAPSALAGMGIAWAVDVPAWFVRFVGICELAGAVGMIAPAATRIAPVLTPLAALGFATIQVLAIAFHAIRLETGQTIAFNLVYLSLSLFVLWGRWTKAPIEPR